MYHIQCLLFLEKYKIDIRCILRFFVRVNLSLFPGTWYGIELDRPAGKNDGSVNGHRYFTCKAKHGVFAPLSRIQK